MKIEELEAMPAFGDGLDVEQLHSKEDSAKQSKNEMLVNKSSGEK